MSPVVTLMEKPIVRPCDGGWYRVWYSLGGERRFLDADSEYQAELWKHNIEEYGCWFTFEETDSDKFHTEQCDQLAESLGELETYPDNAPLVVERFEPPSWFTAYGAHQKAKAIKAKGLPAFRDSRFLTLTMDPVRYPDPGIAYEIGKRHLAQFAYDLGKALGEKLIYCWKLEFHKNGYPHWHMVIIYRKMIDYVLINKCWGKGRTDIKRVRNNDWDYLFKYIAKPVDIPPWAAEYETIRFFQASRGFYTNSQPSSPDRCSGKQKKGHKHKRERLTLGEKIDKWGKTVVIRRPGDLRRTRQVWEDSFVEFLVQQGAKFCTEMNEKGNSPRSFRGAWQIISTKGDVIWQMKKNLLN